ncbi:pre-rRNA-processing protein PNO1 [Candidatus Aenigmatarchaeota archaeon]
MQKLKIPEERLAILIGKRGKVKREIENLTKTKIAVGEDVTIEGECIGILACSNIVKAIGRGFAPEKAMDLSDEDYCLCILSLPEKGKKGKVRVKSRIIGRDGLARERIEMFTKSHISIYGKTVSIIGKYDDVELAKTAIEKLITGSPHDNVFHFLEIMIKKRESKKTLI